jgi:hypothetical protein
MVAGGLGLLIVVSGCSSAGPEVATLEGDGALVDGYVNQATADYAECLKGLGLPASPETDPTMQNLVGYVSIEGAATAIDEGHAMDDPGAPIEVDGADRDQEIRECYADNSGAKDMIIDQRDFDMSAVPDQEVPEWMFEASRTWAECAREAGVSFIEDPDEFGEVVIPEETTLEQAKMLGETCSEPMADDEHWPGFFIQAGVQNDELGMLDTAPYAEALNGPFFASDRAQKYREEHPEEFEGEE